MFFLLDMGSDLPSRLDKTILPVALWRVQVAGSRGGTPDCTRHTAASDPLHPSSDISCISTTHRHHPSPTK